MGNRAVLDQLCQAPVLDRRQVALGQQAAQLGLVDAVVELHQAFAGTHRLAGLEQDLPDHSGDFVGDRYALGGGDRAHRLKARLPALATHLGDGDAGRRRGLAHAVRGQLLLSLLPVEDTAEDQPQQEQDQDQALEHRSCLENHGGILGPRCKLGECSLLGVRDIPNKLAFMYLSGKIFRLRFRHR